MITRSRMWIVLLAPVIGVAGCGSQDAAEPAASGASEPAATAPASDATASAGDDAIDHANNFNIYPGTGVTSVSFDWNGQYAITASQAKSWKGVSAGYSTDNPNIYQITVTAGRHNDPTNDTFSWFKAQAPMVTTTSAAGSCSVEYWSGDQGSMNFAIAGTLTINGKPYPLALGQFGSDSGNVWVFGGSDWPGPMCATSFPTPDSAFTLVSRTEGNDSNYAITIDAQ